MNNTLDASSRNRSVPSSLTQLAVDGGCASKSKSESRHGAGRSRNRSSRRDTDFGGGDLAFEEPFQERGVRNFFVFA